MPAKTLLLAQVVASQFLPRLLNLVYVAYTKFGKCRPLKPERFSP